MGWVRQPKGDVTLWELAMGQRNPEALAVVWLLWLPEELLLPELPEAEEPLLCCFCCLAAFCAAAWAALAACSAAAFSAAAFSAAVFPASHSRIWSEGPEIMVYRLTMSVAP